MFRIHFAQCWTNILGCLRGVVSVKVRCSWIIKGVVHALIFKALFPGCQHSVGERVSLRGEVQIGKLEEDDKKDEERRTIKKLNRGR